MNDDKLLFRIFETNNSEILINVIDEWFSLTDDEQERYKKTIINIFETETFQLIGDKFN